MSESDSFISEVSEEVRRDRMFAYWKKYGVVLVAGIVAIVSASAWWTWQKQAEREAARDLGGRFLEVANAGGDPGAYAELAGSLQGSAAVIARLHEAAAMIQAGDRDGAMDAYRAIATDGEVDPIYADVARLLAAQLGQGLPQEERLALLEPALQPGAPYRLMALETRGAILIAAGDVDLGQADLRAVLDDPLATQDTIGRVTELLLASGGTIE